MLMHKLNILSILKVERMEVFGNVELLKEEISSVMNEKLNTLKQELEEFKGQVSEENGRKLTDLREQHKTTLNQDLKKAYSQIIGEKTLEAKKAYEEKREQLIDEVFAEVLKKSKSITNTAKYVSFVKSQAPKGKNVKVFGDCNYYKKSFSKMKLDKSISGLRFEEGDVSYDFTVERMIKVRKEELRRQVNATLFK